MNQSSDQIQKAASHLPESGFCIWDSQGFTLSETLTKRRYTTYVLEVVSPPLPVQLVWKNSPRGLSVRS